MLFCIGEQASMFKCYSVLVSRLVCLNVILCDGEQDVALRQSVDSWCNGRPLELFLIPTSAPHRCTKGCGMCSNVLSVSLNKTLPSCLIGSYYYLLF